MSDLLDIVERVRTNSFSSFYADKYGDQRFDDFVSVPFLTRQEIVGTPWRKRLFVPETDVDFVRPTSGTSGGGVMLIPRALSQKDFTDPLHRAVYERNDIHCLATYSGAQARHALSFYAHLDVQSLQLDPSDTAASGALCEFFKPDMLAGFVYTTEALIEDDAFSKASRDNIKVIQVFGEKPTKLQWDRLSSAFSHAEVFSEYASVEAGTTLGAGCSEIIKKKEQFIHPFDTYVHMELIDVETQEVITESEKEGELVITTLRPSALPLVRYRTGDRAKRVKGVCNCKRETFSIEGRIEQSRVRIRGGEIILAEIERVLMLYKDNLQTPRFEVHYREQKNKGKGSAPALTLALSYDKRSISAHDLQEGIQAQLRIAPDKTYRDGVESLGFAALEIIDLPPASGKTKGIIRYDD